MTAERGGARAAAVASLAGAVLASLSLAACGGGSSVQQTTTPPGGGGNHSRAAADGLAIKGLPVKVTISPRSGTPHTDFVVGFVAREPTVRATRVRRSYLVTVHGPSRSGCIVSAAAQSQGTRPGDTVSVTLSPAQNEGRVWCRGEYRGRVSITAAFACPASGRCNIPPGFSTRSKRVGAFRFSVGG